MGRGKRKKKQPEIMFSRTSDQRNPLEKLYGEKKILAIRPFNKFSANLDPIQSVTLLSKEWTKKSEMKMKKNGLGKGIKSERY